MADALRGAGSQRVITGPAGARRRKRHSWAARGRAAGEDRGMQTEDVTLYGGPCDGETVAVDPTDPDPGVALPADGCAFLGGRSWYAPGEDGRWRWTGDTP